ncbi:MAG: YdiU family protein [Proteobacteria bacterium]|nr:YdiU family protein [Pseudomonadota bacterium]
MPDAPDFRFDNSYARDLAGFFVRQAAAQVPGPQLLLFNRALAERLGIGWRGVSDAVLAALFSGNQVPEGADPVALVYAGHQFGGFTPRLGDGRALLLGEVVAPDGQRFDVQLKGSGPTPFSRGGDGKSALGPVLREYLVSEAMHRLGVPTTRALAAVATGEYVYRDGAGVPGAVLTRVASSHLRVGTFQYFAARGDGEKLAQLLRYAITRHYPAAAGVEPALRFFRAVLAAQARLVARWMSIGFIHGVMNTDNTSIAGETIDYGPCAFLDRYHPGQVFSSIDTGGRYAFGNQPLIAHWNLARLAETLIGLVGPDEQQAIAELTAELDRFPAVYEAEWLSLMRAKLGLSGEEAGDGALVRDLHAAMARGEADFTLTFRFLSIVVRGDDASFLALFNGEPSVPDWLAQYRARIGREAGEPEMRATAMDRINPLYIPRNHLVDAAISAAEGQGDLAPLVALAGVLDQPFTEQAGKDGYAAPLAGHDRRFRTFCGT